MPTSSTSDKFHSVRDASHATMHMTRNTPLCRPRGRGSRLGFCAGGKKRIFEEAGSCFPGVSHGHALPCTPCTLATDPLGCKRRRCPSRPGRPPRKPLQAYSFCSQSNAKSVRVHVGEIVRIFVAPLLEAILFLLPVRCRGSCCWSCGSIVLARLSTSTLAQVAVRGKTRKY